MHLSHTGFIAIFIISDSKINKYFYFGPFKAFLNSFRALLFIGEHMAAFTEEQKRIAILLMNEAKTEEELNKQLNMPYDKLTNELRHMLKLKVITKEGYPTKYLLKPEIVEEVKKRKKIAEQDAYKIRIRGIIDFQAVTEELLTKHMKKIKEALEKEKVFTIYSIDLAEPEPDSDMMSSFMEVNMTVKDFSALIRFLFYYGPSTIEVIRPSKIELSQYEFEAGLVDLANIFQKYATYFTKKLTKEELAKFQDRIYN